MKGSSLVLEIWAVCLASTAENSNPSNSPTKINENEFRYLYAKMDGGGHQKFKIYHIKFGHWTHAAYENVRFDNRRNA